MSETLAVNDALTRQQLDALLAEARRKLPIETQRVAAFLDDNFGGDPVQSLRACRQDRYRMGVSHPLRKLPELAAFMRSEESRACPDGNGVSIATWFDWQLDYGNIAREPYCNPEWIPQRVAIQKAAESTRLTDTVVFRGESWPADEIPTRFPVGGSFRTPRLLSATRRAGYAQFYALRETTDVAEWDGVIQQPAILVFTDPGGVTGVRIPPACAGGLDEVILPRSADYTVTTVDRDGVYVRIGLAASH